MLLDQELAHMSVAHMKSGFRGLLLAWWSFLLVSLYKCASFNTNIFSTHIKKKYI